MINTEPNFFENLPNEYLVKLMSKLPQKGAVDLGSTCQRLNEACNYALFRDALQEKESLKNEGAKIIQNPLQGIQEFHEGLQVAKNILNNHEALHALSGESPMNVEDFLNMQKIMNRLDGYNGQLQEAGRQIIDLARNIRV